MRTDYGAIRAENTARYGWDTAVLELLGQLYADRTHFIFELIQNAEDAGATELSFDLAADHLLVRHDGRPFTTADVRGVCGVSEGTKSADLTQIGRFGIGFKSVYAYTNSPSVRSGQEHFTIRKYVQPWSAGPPAKPADRMTTLTFPFDRAEVSAKIAFDEISVALGELTAEILLFLRHIRRISIGPGSQDGTVLKRVPGPQSGARRLVELVTDRAGRRDCAQWVIWSRSLDQLGEAALAVEIAFLAGKQADRSGLARVERSPLVVFFPTEKETFLGFLLQGPFRTTPARDNVPAHDEWNQALVRETAQLLREVMTGLREERLLTAGVLQALPLDPARFPRDSMFRPLFDAVRDTITKDRMIPDDAGGYLAPAQVWLPASAGLRELLAPEQLGWLGRAADRQAFAAGEISPEETPLLWRYLRDEAGAREVTPSTLIGALTGEFLALQPDDWICRFYQFLYQHSSLWQGPESPVTGKPIIRLSDGSQALPFNGAGRPAAYLPGPVTTQLPTVKPGIAGHQEAHRFLAALGFAEADVVAEVIDHVLPRYAGAGADTLDLAQHEADLELAARALDQAAHAEHELLVGQLARTTFLIGENAATGQVRLMCPADLYQRTAGLELYFAGNPAAWFAADRYGPWRAQLRGMGVSQEVRLMARPADQLGYVVIADEFARHERGLAGFDPAASLDGLEFALDHPSAARSEFVWNFLLLPNSALIAGIVERSPRPGFADASRERSVSLLGKAAMAAAWLPAPDGTFARPADTDLADLPVTFASDEGLARALGMTRTAVDEANSQLGFPPDFLRRLAGQADLVELVERELIRREASGGPPGPPLPLL